MLDEGRILAKIDELEGYLAELRFFLFPAMFEDTKLPGKKTSHRFPIPSGWQFD